MTKREPRSQKLRVPLLMLVLSLIGCATPAPQVVPCPAIPQPAAELMQSPPAAESYSMRAQRRIMGWREKLESLLAR